MSHDPDDADRLDLADHAVASSEPGDPAETIAKLVGDDHGLASLTERFVEAGVSVRIEDYFLEGETRHELRFGDRVEHVPCVADALQAAVLVDHDPATVRSVDPVTGRPVTFEVADDGLAVTPADALVSFGVARALVESTPDSVDAIDLSAGMLAGDDCTGVDGDVRDLYCRYINAFERRETYREWATDVDAVTVALPAEPLVTWTRRFVAGPVFE